MGDDTTGHEPTSAPNLDAFMADAVDVSTGAAKAGPALAIVARDFASLVPTDTPEGRRFARLWRDIAADADQLGRVGRRLSGRIADLEEHATAFRDTLGGD